jgi:hypothetical protein
VREPAVLRPDGSHGQAIPWLSRKTEEARRHKIEGRQRETANKTKGMYIIRTEYMLAREGDLE